MVFRVLLGGREINRWNFEEIYLWELDARRIVAEGTPGLLALTPLMRHGSDRALIEEAARRIESAFPRERLSDAEDVLLALASRYYTVSELARMVGRDRMMESSLYQAGRSEGLSEGLSEGRLEVAREVCAALARKHHPAVFDRARPLIDSCQDLARLREWALGASDLRDADFLRLLGV